MYKHLFLAVLACALSVSAAQSEPTTYSFDTNVGTLEVTPIGHGSLRLELSETVIHVDPYSGVADYSQQPDADWVWITHEHGDHLDPAALQEVVTETRFVMDSRSAEQYSSGSNAETGGAQSRVTVMANGDSLELDGFTLQAVPA